jgi:hypothetical protein
VLEIVPQRELHNSVAPGLRRDLPKRSGVDVSRRNSPCSSTQFDPRVVEVFSTIPEEHWTDLRERLGSPFRLAHSKNLWPNPSRS